MAVFQKMLKNIFLSLICVMLIATTMSCKKSCGLNCQHNGSCSTNASSCNCPDPYSGKLCDTMCAPGYEGYMCLTPSRTRFVGTTWSCTSRDQTGASQTFLINFTVNNGDPTWMNMNNFNNITYPVVCTMTGKYVFSADAYNQVPQGMTAGLSGDGKLTDGTLVLNVTMNGSQYFCTATKQ